MRRFTLLTILGLLGLLTAATIYQVALVKGKPHNLVGPGLKPGPGQVILTNLVGLSRSAAIAALRDNGLVYEINPVGDGRQDTDRVTQQRPPGGILLDRGARVRLDVDCVPAPCPEPTNGKPIVDPCGCGTA